MRAVDLFASPVRSYLRMRVGDSLDTDGKNKKRILEMRGGGYVSGGHQRKTVNNITYFENAAGLGYKTE